MREPTSRSMDSEFLGLEIWSKQPNLLKHMICMWEEREEGVVLRVCVRVEGPLTNSDKP